MYTAIRKSLNKENDKGFTLIELLVVIIIIGILAAIAIPIFLNQRKKAVDASLKSDVRSIATQFETYYTDSQLYPVAGEYDFTAATATVNVGTEKVVMSPGNVPTAFVNGTGTAFCISADNTGKSTRAYVWQSDNGGLQASPTASCAAYGTALTNAVD